MDTIWTEDSRALRELAEARSAVLWAYSKSPPTKTDIGIQECLVLDGVHPGLSWNYNVHNPMEYRMVTPEEFIAECARRYPKKTTRPAAEIIGDIEKAFFELRQSRWFFGPGEKTPSEILGDIEKLIAEFKGAL